MCIVCERELWGEHRALEREFFKACKTCKKFPAASSQGTCYHCFAVGSTIGACPECAGKPWSERIPRGQRGNRRPRQATGSVLARI